LTVLSTNFRFIAARLQTQFLRGNLLTCSSQKYSESYKMCLPIVIFCPISKPASSKLCHCLTPAWPCIPASTVNWSDKDTLYMPLTDKSMLRVSGRFLQWPLRMIFVVVPL
jgi:hypothetical protein